MVIADFFSSTNMAYFRQLRAQVQDLDIALLVVCAGFKRADWFKNVPTEGLQRMLDLNVYHYCGMLKTFLPGLVARDGRQAVVIVSSMQERVVVPVNIIYGATKAFTGYLGYAL